MYRIKALVKIPTELTEGMLNKLYELGVETVEVEMIPHEQFVRESRLNYDCVFPQMWEGKSDVSYLRFYFDDSPEGREAGFRLEYDFMQIPLNLCYEEH